MSCVKIPLGDLDRKIHIERRTRTTDNLGGATEVWAADPTDGVWARLKNLTGTERWEAQRVMPGNVIRVLLRWRDDGNGNPYYSASDRVLHQGRYYTILSVIDLEYAREYIQMDIQEGKP